MKERKALQPNTDLRFTNFSGGEMHYVVGNIVGRGGSCIVYDGYYLNNAGMRCTVRIKECYPYKLHLEREENGSLKATTNEAESFCEYKDRLRNSFDIANTFHQTSGLTNVTSNLYDIYEANNTVYIVSSYAEGNTLAHIEFEKLSDAIRAVLSVSKGIEKIHNNGFLYLDVKPENVLIYSETFELIQMFDFDSVIPINSDKRFTDYRVSYSTGFAPLEQKLGNMDGVGPHSDVYSIGALLFYLLFGRSPKATDCGFDAEYDYEKLQWNTLYQDKLYGELTSFFHNTLQAYYKDRYQTMGEVTKKLEVIAKYAELPVPFICVGYVSNGGLVIGREEECKRIDEWCHSDKKMLFITGMGGIGKSTIVRKFISENKKKFDNVVYLQFRDSIEETIIDDVQFCINGYEKKKEETVKEYFLRKIKRAKELVAETNSLLVIDNYSGVIDNEFREILNVNWKVIVVTRSDMSNTGYDCHRIHALSSKGELYKLFEDNINKELVSQDYRKLDRLIDLVAGHTLALVLIARQIDRSFIDINMALKLAMENGFSEIAPEKVKYMQDGKEYYGKISAIIKAIYDTNTLSEKKKKILKVLSIFDIRGIAVNRAKDLLKEETLDDINELVDMGWLELSGKDVCMHPLIQETLQQISWTSETRQIVYEEFKYLVDIIKLNGRRDEYPKKMYEKNKRINDDILISDYKLLRSALNDAKAVLLHTGKDEMMSKEKEYKELLFTTLINSPKDQEEYIVDNSERFFSDTECANPNASMELYDYVVYIQCQKKAYDETLQYLNRAKMLAKKMSSNYIWGLYYDMLGDFYEEFLNGAYCSDDKNERDLLNKLLQTIDKAIHYMGKSKHEKSKTLYAKYGLSKAALMIRSVPEKSQKIKRLITGMKKVIDKYTTDYAEVRSTYYMVWAWYYTLCEPKQDCVEFNLRKAKEINNVRAISELDVVDYYYIPAANMMCELGDIETTLDLLGEAYKICESHVDEIPYICKKLDLLEYQLEVCYEEGNMERRWELLNRIKSVNEEAKEWNLEKMVGEDLVKRTIQGQY